MDVISHGLWGSIAFGRKNRNNFWYAFLFGIAPDLIPFVPFIVSIIFSDGLSSFGGRPDVGSIPEYVFALYSFTHSIAIFLIAFLSIRILTGTFFLPMSAWGLHILFDIPFHSKAFFPTPFFWPFSDFMIDGIPWSHPFIFFPNIILVLGFFIWFFVLPAWKRRNIDKAKKAL